MKVVILHRVPFAKARYDLVIDHASHEVHYIGTEAALDKLPETLRCVRHCRTPKIQAQVRHIWPDQLLALSEYDLLLAADLREQLGIPGPNRAETLLVRDKVLMKEAIARAGINHPKFTRAGNLLAGLHPPYILKPTEGASSEGVEIINDSIQLCQRLAQVSDLSQYEVEEYLEGPVFHFDGWMHNGEIMDFVPSQYVNNCHDYVLGVPLGSHQFADQDGLLRGWSARVLHAVQIKNGAFHLEGIFSRGRLFFLEVAHRVGGAAVAQTFELKTGVNLYHAHIAAMLGWPPPPYRGSTSREVFGWFVFPGHSANFNCTTGTAIRLRNSSEVFQLQTNFSVSGKLSYDASESPLSGCVRAKCASRVREVIDEIFTSVSAGHAQTAEASY